MEIDIHFALAYHTTNVNVFDMNWKSFGHAIWYDTRIETYNSAMQRVEDIIWERIYNKFPHLKGIDRKLIESGELPVIDYNK